MCWQVSVKKKTTKNKVRFKEKWKYKYIYVWSLIWHRNTEKRNGESVKYGCSDPCCAFTVFESAVKSQKQIVSCISSVSEALSCPRKGNRFHANTSHSVLLTPNRVCLTLTPAGLRQEARKVMLKSSEEKERGRDGKRVLLMTQLINIESLSSCITVESWCGMVVELVCVCLLFWGFTVTLKEFTASLITNRLIRTLLSNWFTGIIM